MKNIAQVEAKLLLGALLSSGKEKRRNAVKISRIDIMMDDGVPQYHMTI